MIQIYCLVDPRNNCPFYVGASKVPLNKRLSGHIHDEAINFLPPQYGVQFTSYEKHLLIKNLISNNLRPRIDLLYITTVHGVDYYEQFFYAHLTKQGFILFNKQQHFNYLKYTKVEYYNFTKIN